MEGSPPDSPSATYQILLGTCSGRESPVKLTSAYKFWPGLVRARDEPAPTNIWQGLVSAEALGVKHLAGTRASNG